MALAPAGVEEPLDATFALCRQSWPECGLSSWGGGCRPEFNQSFVRVKNLLDKWASRGAEALDDTELLAVLTGDAALAEALLRSAGGSLARLASQPEARLRMVGGLGLPRARMLLACAELGRRIAASRAQEVEIIRTSDDAVRLFRPLLEGLSYEECWVLYLSGSNRIVERQRVSQGGVQGTVVDHRLVVKRALELLSTQLILIHNHPSGAAEASPQDRVLTDKIVRAAALFDIRVLDHIIISREGDFSFRREGLLG